MDLLPPYSEILTEGRQLTTRSECKMMGFDSGSNLEIFSTVIAAWGRNSPMAFQPLFGDKSP